MNAVLSRTAIFQDVNRDAMAALEAELEWMTFPRNHTVFAEGEPGDRLYVVVQGKVKVGRRSGDGRESLIAVMGPGETFGELALFDPGPRTATALTEVRVAAVLRQALSGWIAERPEISEQLLFASRGWIRQQGKSVFVLEPAKLARRAR
ncbi:MAG: cyclic nucleotide-binding domain-containing protein [Mycobacterium sp.]